MAKRRAVPGVHPYDGPAGGWGALKATAIAVRTQMDTLEAPVTLMRTNQPDGFDCPGCAWPDKEHRSTFQFCENGAKAVTWEATSKRVTAEFLAQNTVTSLLRKTDYELEDYGRLTTPCSMTPGPTRCARWLGMRRFNASPPFCRRCRRSRWSFILPAARPMRRPICSSCLRGNLAAITSPTVPICAMSRPA